MEQTTPKPKVRLLVCGGRTFGTVNGKGENMLEAMIAAQKESALLCHVLSNLKREHEIEVLIEGCAPGTDRLAGDWADANQIAHDKYPANWDAHGKRAGFLRNQQMLEEGNPTLVVAFPGGNGTADMVRRAKKAGVKVLEVDYVG